MKNGQECKTLFTYLLAFFWKKGKTTICQNKKGAF